MSAPTSRLFPAVLKFWRRRGGLSQLDLAIAAQISARHLSFLETGRARPGREMVLRLGAALGLSLRDQNTLLDAAGFEAAYAEPSFARGLPREIEQVIERMIAQHEPFPLVVLDRGYDVLRASRGAQCLLARFVARPERLTQPLNILRMMFDPELGRPFVANWESVARSLLSRLHREILARPQDPASAELLRELCAYPDVPSSWHKPDFSAPEAPALTLRVRRDDLELNFLATIIMFNAPQNVTLEEIKIDSYFPLDEQTAQACARLVQG